MRLKERTNTDRWLLVGVLSALTGMLVLVASAFIQLKDFDRRIVDRDLGTTQQLLRYRLDRLVNELSTDLAEEAAAIAMMDTIHTDALFARWRPLLAAQWPIVALRLADERGNETALLRGPDSLTVSVVTSGNGHTANGAVAGNRYDPRKQAWFSKALEEARGQPVWHLDGDEGDIRHRLQLSLLIRGRRTSDPYHVIAAEVDLERTHWLEMRYAPLDRAGTMLLNGDGQPLLLDGPDLPGDSIGPAAAAMHAWNADRTRWPFALEHNGEEYRASITAYTANGMTLYTGCVLAVSTVSEWTRSGRAIVWTGVGLVVVLSILLMWAWQRSREADQRLRRQAKRSRSQERKLVKALGEREVLNREVHHRVKNNLQVVSSLLNLQSSRLEDGPVRNEFLRGKQRIDTIALVHHKLYSSDDLRNVDLNAFINGLIEGLAAMHKPQHTAISHEVNTGNLHTDQDTAIELGIIVCELVANAYQHAFPHATGGHIDILVQHVEGDLYRLVVKDNGRGLPDGYAQGRTKMGLEIVEAMAEQLDGSFHMHSNGGVTFEVLFRMQPDKTLPDV
jgi:two-component sensor histidine kinase